MLATKTMSDYDYTDNEYYMLPITFDGLVQAFQGTGLSTNIFVLYVDQTGFDSDSDNEDDEPPAPFTSGSFYVSYIQVHNGVVHTQSAFMCMDFQVPGDQLENFTIEDFAKMIGSVQSAYPWCNVERSTAREIPGNHWIFDSFNTGVTDDPDYCYNRFFEYGGAIFIFSDWNLSDNLIGY